MGVSCLLDMRAAVGAIAALGFAATVFAQPCADVTLRLRCLRQPAVFHRGEAIRASLSVTATGRAGLTALPGLRRGFFHEIVSWEPRADAVDPLTLDPRIRVGDEPGSGLVTDRNREIDLNEWVQFRSSGQYALRVRLKRFEQAWCELMSNAESIQILPPDAQWEAAELARIVGMLGSEATRLAGASALRYLNTRDAAVELTQRYLRSTAGPAEAELGKGIFESQYAEVVQAELEKALRSGAPFTEDALGTLALLEVRRQFANRPCPPEADAARAWSREYWALFASVKRKYEELVKRR